MSFLKKHLHSHSSSAASSSALADSSKSGPVFHDDIGSTTSSSSFSASTMTSGSMTSGPVIAEKVTGVEEKGWLGKSLDKVETAEAAMVGVMAAQAQIVQPFKRERVVTSHYIPRVEKIEKELTKLETVQKTVPVSVNSERVVMEEVDKVVNVTVKVLEPRVETVERTVEVAAASEVVELVEVEKQITVTIKVREPRVSTVTRTVATIVPTEVVRMVEVEKVIPVNIRVPAPRVESVNTTASVSVPMQKPVVEKIQESREVMDKVLEIQERVLPDGPAQLRTLPIGAQHTQAAPQIRDAGTTYKETRGDEYGKQLLNQAAPQTMPSQGSLSNNTTVPAVAKIPNDYRDHTHSAAAYTRGAVTTDKRS